MDAGAAYELKMAKLSSLAALTAGVVLTVAFWLYLGMK